jgi:drug/metabolite transporter (DMT)-like permease
MKALRSILVSVLLIAAAQLLMKKGVSYVPFNTSNLLSNYVLFLNPFLIIGLVSLFVGTVVWLSVLSKSELSYAYPLLSIGYIVVALASMFLLGENLGFMRWSGIFTICIGVFLMSKS